MAKSSFDGNGYHFLPVPSAAGHFVSHALMSPFVSSSNSRSLYTTSGAFSPAIPPALDSHPAPVAAFENPSLPHFSQAFH